MNNNRAALIVSFTLSIDIIIGLFYVKNKNDTALAMCAAVVWCVSLFIIAYVIYRICNCFHTGTVFPITPLSKIPSETKISVINQ